MGGRNQDEYSKYPYGRRPPCGPDRVGILFPLISMYSGEPVLPVWEAATPLSIKEWIRFKNRFKKTGGELTAMDFVRKLVF